MSNAYVQPVEDVSHKNGMFRPSDRSEPWSVIQGAVWAPITATFAGRKSRMPLISVYFRNLTQAAARGVPNAHREQIWLLKRLDEQGILAAPEPELPEREAFLSRLKRHSERVEFIQKLNAIIYSKVQPEIHQRFVRLHGQHRIIEQQIPDHVNLQWLCDIMPGIQRRIRKQRAATEYDVGHCKPPPASRWQTGHSGNPSGLPKARDDAFEVLREALSEELTIGSNGKTKRMPALAVGIRQLFMRAMKDDPQARRQVREILTVLDSKGLLGQPVPLKPVGRGRQSGLEKRAEVSGIHELYIVALITQMKREIIKCYSFVYGPIPDMKTKFEKKYSNYRKLRIYKDLPRNAKCILRALVTGKYIRPESAFDEPGEDCTAPSAMAEDNDGQEEVLSSPRQAPARRRRPMTSRASDQQIPPSIDV
jgi:hypothetical protein